MERFFSIFDVGLIERLCDLGCLQYRQDNPFVLNSGQKTSFYFSTRVVYPDLFWLIGRCLVSLLQFKHYGAYPLAPGKTICLVGVPEAGKPIATAMVLTNHICGFTRLPMVDLPMRSHPKQHGASLGRCIEIPAGWDWTQYDCWLVENVLTSGKSCVEAAHQLIRDSAAPSSLKLLALVDRDQGAPQKLAASGMFETVLVAHSLRTVITQAITCGRMPAEALAAYDRELETV